MPTPNRPIRVDDETWAAAKQALQQLAEPRRVVVTLQPGATRAGAVQAFLRAVARHRP